MTKQDSQMTLRHLLEEAKGVLAELHVKGDQHDKAKKDLADLYNSIFTGPTQEFPEEDERENQVQAAQIYHDQVQAAINRESQAAEILARADETMASCESKMRDALGYSQWDMWGGGNVSDMLERSALGNAQSFAFQAQVLVEQARRISQLVQPIGPVNIAQGFRRSILTDVFFDNIFTDMAFHDKIKRSADEVGQARSRIREECENANQRTEAIGRDLLAAVENLKRCRNELDSSRRAAFESITGRSDTPSSLPPAYEAASALSMPEPAKPADPLEDVSAHWGNRNPYAAALAQRSKSSIEEPQAGSS
ncbi:hypothetical protein BD779DRAFT_1715171 [Infundibulicybe gibba]|nr:hypothetical protein BD779DRAFT_1715171 [Infundibulicybe gibba]